MWKCVNDNCANFEKEIDLQAYDAFINGSIYLTKKEQQQYRTCCVCGGLLDFSMPDRFKSDGVPNFLKFDSLSDADKKKVIRKRYENAMKKDDGYDKIRQKKQDRINLMRGEQ